MGALFNRSRRRMFRDFPSQTAVQVALGRAAHQLFDSPKVLDDPFALRILGAGGALALMAGALFHASPPARQMRAYLVARSRIVEDELALAVRHGVHQYVVLGAGLDTFAHRNPYSAAKLRLFEVDLPTSQAHKRRLLAEAGMAEPKTLRYVPVDFETQELGAQLAQAGFRADQPAFFSWLGVSMYLTAPAVAQLLTFVAARPRGSAIVFDYMVPPASMDALQRWPLQAMGALVAAAGEPWRSHFEPEALNHQLRGLGFTLLHDMGVDDINARVFAHSQGGGLRASAVARLMHAEI
jgi:methyltransferase (TIGR00027 family)